MARAGVVLHLKHSEAVEVFKDAATDAKGKVVRMDERAHVAQASGHQLRVRLHHSPQFRALARGSVIRRPIFGRLFPVAAIAATPAAEAA